MKKNITLGRQYHVLSYLTYTASVSSSCSLESDLQSRFFHCMPHDKPTCDWQ